MTQKTPVVFIVLLIALSHAVPVVAAGGEPPLCVPGAEGDDCLMAGPAAYLQQQAAFGITFPLTPLVAADPPAELRNLPYSYARITVDGPAEVFASPEDGRNKIVKRVIPAGLRYITWLDTFDYEGKTYVMLAPGEWMRRIDLSLGVAPSAFAGKLFSATPERPFGWTLIATESQRAPGLDAPLTGRVYTRWDMFQVYDIRETGGLRYYLIGPDEWLSARWAAIVEPMAAPPAGVDNGRWIEINLEQQTLAVYQEGQLLFATLTSTGLNNWWTRPGLFPIYEKHESTPMTGAFEADRSDYYNLEDVPWTMYFDEARALHGAYWHQNYGFENSHGCANLSPSDSNWLYNWAELGDWVYVHDPSGQTPTDPSLYGEGGA
jgi:hypothetical protein